MRAADDVPRDPEVPRRLPGRGAARGVVLALAFALGCGGVTAAGPDGAAGNTDSSPGSAGAGGTGSGTGGAGGMACPAGSEGCACYGNDTCDGALRCASHLCVSLGGAGGGGAAGTAAAGSGGSSAGAGGRGGTTGTGNTTGTGGAGTGGGRGGTTGTGNTTGTGGTGCATGCPDGSVCQAGACACVAPCPSGSNCVAGAPNAHGGSACLCTATGQMVCPLAGTLYCVDTRTSTANCGTCGHVCELPAGTCSGGVCGN